MRISHFAAAAVAAALTLPGAAFARDQIMLTGSSTVLPFANIVAEAFGQNTDFATPVVEGGGSGAGAGCSNGVGRGEGEREGRD